MDVIEGVKGWRLSAIVNILRSEYGWPIVTEYRGPERIGHYHLSKTCDRLTLQYPPSAKPLLEELVAMKRRDPGTGEGGGSGGLHG